MISLENYAVIRHRLLSLIVEERQFSFTEDYINVSKCTADYEPKLPANHSFLSGIISQGPIGLRN